jgi:hypothetical protein
MDAVMRRAYDDLYYDILKQCTHLLAQRFVTGVDSLM